MSPLDYSRKVVGRDALAFPFAVGSLCVGIGANIWGALAAWSIHAAPYGATIHPLRLEMFLFFQAMTAALIGVGFALCALFRGRGRVGLILLACLGMHLSLTPYLVSNAVLDHVITRRGLVLE